MDECEGLCVDLIDRVLWTRTDCLVYRLSTLPYFHLSIFIRGIGIFVAYFLVYICLSMVWIRLMGR